MTLRYAFSSRRSSAASLVTWFTFLPSFLFILAGGQLVEATHGALKFAGPLTTIRRARWSA